jgi:hypothetical protein
MCFDSEILRQTRVGKFGLSGAAFTAKLSRKEGKASSGVTFCLFLLRLQSCLMV